MGNENLIFSITFSECFENQDIILKINDDLRIDLVGVNSNPVLGISSAKIEYWKSTGLIIKQENLVNDTIPMVVENEFNLSISLALEDASLNSDFTVNYNNGNNIFIDACSYNSDHVFNLIYYKDKIIIE